MADPRPPRPAGAEATAIAVCVALLAIALGWASRGNLNVDGVAYLDLAGRLLAGDWAGFVQGYWSPAYPALLAIWLGITGLTAAPAAAFAHFLNVLIALFAIALTWRLARQEKNRSFTRFAFTALLVVSARTLRIDAVTPDLLLLAVMIGLATELLRPAGFRALHLGLWAGVAFLVKTSVWPWLLISGLATMLVRRRDRLLRRRLMRAGAITAVVMATWIVPMSLDVGYPTIGDTGRYGYGWYLQLSDGRSPDTHRGGHQNYSTEVVGDGQQLRVAHFTAERWTWPPWSDPSAWQRGITSQSLQPIEPASAIIYWLKLFALSFGLWAAPVLLLVVVPLVLLSKWKPLSPQRPARPAEVVLIGIGIVGVLQFVAVHAEPRLIAPFLMLAALGVIAWYTPKGESRLLHAISWSGLGIALLAGVLHIPDQLKVTASTRQRMAQLEASNVHPPNGRVVVMGNAFPLLPDLYRADLHVVAQIFDPPPAVILAWPSDAQNQVAELIREAGSNVVWISKGRDGYRIVTLADAR